MDRFSCNNSTRTTLHDVYKNDMETRKIIVMNSSLDELESLGKDSLSRTPPRRSDNKLPMVTDDESVVLVPIAEIIELEDFNTPQYFRRVL